MAYRGSFPWRRDVVFVLFQTRGGKGEVLSDYLEFIAGKDRSTSFNRIPEEWMPEPAFDYQKTIIRWALRKGRACIFAGTGLGKTLMELVWAENVQRFSKWRVLVLAPLALPSIWRRSCRAMLSCPPR